MVTVIPSSRMQRSRNDDGLFTQWVSMSQTRALPCSPDPLRSPALQPSARPGAVSMGCRVKTGPQSRGTHSRTHSPASHTPGQESTLSPAARYLAFLRTRQRPPPCPGRKAGLEKIPQNKTVLDGGAKAQKQLSPFSSL